jgi:hypothetical protein
MTRRANVIEWFLARCRQSFVARRRHWMLARHAWSDDRFLKTICIKDAERNLVLGLRDALADCCRLPRRLIYPADLLQDLEKFMPWGMWDELEFVLHLRTRTGTQIDRRTLRLPPVRGNVTVGEWISLAAVAVNESWQNRPKGFDVVVDPGTE